jgi:hypothetical protein
MDFNFFENEIFCQIFNMNLNKNNMKIFKKNLKMFWKLFQENSKNILGIFSQKQSQKQSKSKRVSLMLSHLHPNIEIFMFPPNTTFKNHPTHTYITMMVILTPKQCNEWKSFNNIVNFFNKINNLSNFKKMISLQIGLWIEFKIYEWKKHWTLL